jgi:transcriptional regulator with XRE-family HTH domain
LFVDKEFRLPYNTVAQDTEVLMSKKKKPEESAMVEQIRQAVRESGQTLTQLAERTGVDQGRLSRFLSGQRMLHLDAGLALCEALGLELRPAASPAGGKPPRRKKEEGE